MSRRIITAEDVAAMDAGAGLVVDDNTTLTASARDLARRRGIAIEERAAGPTHPPIPNAQGAHGEAGESAPAVGAASQLVGQSQPTQSSGAGATAGGIIVTAVGVNRPHVMAELTEAISRLGGDIQDVSQRITGGYFNAILVVDAGASGHSFKHFRDGMLSLSEPSDYVVTVIDERVFRAMHRI